MTVLHAAVGCLPARDRQAYRRRDSGRRRIDRSPDKAEETVRSQDLTFPVGYGLDVRATAATFGAFSEERRGILQSTGYVTKPDGTIAVAQYSSGPIGRLVWRDVLALVQHYKKQAQ